MNDINLKEKKDQSNALVFSYALNCCVVEI